MYNCQCIIDSLQVIEPTAYNLRPKAGHHLYFVCKSNKNYFKKKDIKEYFFQDDTILCFRAFLLA